MKLGVLTVTKRPHRLEATKRMLEAQGRRPDAWIIIGHGFDPMTAMEERFVEGCTLSLVECAKAERLATIRNHGFDLLVATGCDVIATFDDDDYYAPTYFSELEEVMHDYPHGAIYGMNNYWIGWVPAADGLASDGGNIYGRWASKGGAIIEFNRVTWVVDATYAIRADVWRDNPGLRFGLKPLREDGSEPGGECEAVMEEAGRLELPIIARKPDHFCVARLDSPDGWGGAHGHTWGPLMPKGPDPVPEPETKSEHRTWQLGDLLHKVGDYLEATIDSMATSRSQQKPLKGELLIYVRRMAAGRILLPKFLWGCIIEDTNLPVGLIQFRVHDGSDTYIVKSVTIGQGES